MNPTAIRDYINQLPFTEAFLALSVELQDKIMFASREMLRRRYAAAVITDELVALQTLYFYEGEKEEFAKFRRQGVNNMQVEDIRFTFEKNSGANIAPEVVAIVEAQTGTTDLGGGGIVGTFY